MPEPTNRNRLEQGRAQDAYDCARKVKDDKKLAYSDYVSFVNDLPMLIKTNGLGAALAFATYKNDASKKVYEQLAAWLAKDHKQLIDLTDGKKLYAEIVKQDSLVYRQVTIEALAWLNWLRRFAKGIKKEENASNG